MNQFHFISFNFSEAIIDTILYLLTYMHFSDKSMESILRSRAMVISGRLLSKENYMFADESSKICIHFLVLQMLGELLI